MPATHDGKTGWKQRLIHELSAYLLYAFYLFIFFGLFTMYRRLIMEEYHLSYMHYGINLIKAVVLAKVIMIGDFLGLGHRFKGKPLIYSTLFKSAVFGLFVAVFSVLEHMLDGLLHGQGLMAGLTALLREGTDELLASSLVIFFAFLPFFAFRELQEQLGKDKMRELFFGPGKKERRPARGI